MLRFYTFEQKMATVGLHPPSNRQPIQTILKPSPHLPSIRIYNILISSIPLFLYPNIRYPNIFLPSYLLTTLFLILSCYLCQKSI